MFFVTTPAMAKTMFWVMAAIFVLSLVTANALLIFYATVGLILAGYILGDTLEKTSAHR
jgi:hypothetical protein